MNRLQQHCVDSWKRYCPDYDIVEWNENNFDVALNAYVRQAYACKKYAFVSDVARLKIIHEHGGFYFDNDVEIIRPLDDLRQHQAFFGMEPPGNYGLQVATGLGFGAIKGNPIVSAMLSGYNEMEFLLPNGEQNMTACPRINTSVLLEKGFMPELCANQVVEGAVLYTPEWFSPELTAFGARTTKNTYTIHYYNGSWKPAKTRLYERAIRLSKNLFSDSTLQQIKVWKHKINRKSPDGSQRA